MKFKKLLIHLIIPLSVGGAGYFLCRNYMDIYKDIVKPPLSPPMVLFPIVWTILYLLMGYSSYLISERQGLEKKKRMAYCIYATQLVLNFLWMPAFFIWRNFLVALIILLCLYFFIWQMIELFREIQYKAGTLQIPYAIWATFALYLNLAILILNR